MDVNVKMTDANANVNKQTERRKPMKTIEISDCKMTALIDTGSEVNLLTDEYYKLIGSPKFDEGHVSALVGLGQLEVKPLGKVTLSVKIDKEHYNNVLFHVVNRSYLPYDVIIGQDFLRRVVLIMEDGRVSLRMKDDEWMKQVGCYTCDSVVVDYIGDIQYKEQLTEMVENYQPLQVKEAPIQMKIVLKDDIPVTREKTRTRMMIKVGPGLRRIRRRVTHERRKIRREEIHEIKKMKRKKEKKMKQKKTRKKKRKEVILGERKIKVMMNE
ncbi:hypothetical protein JYU34_007420 [Plutella xylostella]|uniref:Peptidase A2 domain-containing protein n=1 Tax=Plutella xylostella TaxID=51655 RepID=A0ABQ7QQE0_PLUXY|nr:hypothetical protein JYU34_007420 [Plutella xylostella]